MSYFIEARLYFRAYDFNCRCGLRLYFFSSFTGARSTAPSRKRQSPAKALQRPLVRSLPQPSPSPAPLPPRASIAVVSTSGTSTDAEDRPARRGSACDRGSWSGTILPAGTSRASWLRAANLGYVLLSYDIEFRADYEIYIYRWNCLADRVEQWFRLDCEPDAWYVRRISKDDGSF